MTTITFDLDAFERRLARQQVIGFSDVEVLIDLLRSEHAARVVAEQIVSAARAYRAAVQACDGTEQALFAALDVVEKEQ